MTLTLRERNKHSRSPHLVVTTHSRIHTGPPTRHQQPSGKHGSARNQLIELRTFPETIPHEERNAKLTAHINTAAPAGTQRAAFPAGSEALPPRADQSGLATTRGADDDTRSQQGCAALLSPPGPRHLPLRYRPPPLLSAAVNGRARDSSRGWAWPRLPGAARAAPPRPQPSPRAPRCL